MQTDSTCTVYSVEGPMCSWSTPLDSQRRSRAPPARSTIAADVPIAAIMAIQVVCARPELRANAIARLLVDHHIGCVPVVDDNGRPIGIVTKSDLVERLDGRAAIDSAQTAVDIMMPLAITLDERATVADATAMFVSEDFHHVMIVSATGILIGVVSTKDVVRWLDENDRAARRE
jgi:CBS-domain-containing membrane protein